MLMITRLAQILVVFVVLRGLWQVWALGALRAGERVEALDHLARERRPPLRPRTLPAPSALCCGWGGDLCFRWGRRSTASCQRAPRPTSGGRSPAPGGRTP